MCVIKREYGDLVLRTDEGLYRFYVTGCGQGLAVKDAAGNYVTAFAIDALVADYGWGDGREDMVRRAQETICAAVTAIEVTRHVMNNKEAEKSFVEAVKERMAERGLKGEVLVAA
jgi:cyclopropane fatty-acyl-phospholipid synthase-like methyltransferase